MTFIKEPKKWYIKLFTLGKNFSSRTFSDNSKKYLLNAIGLFIVVTFTFYVESVGDDYEKRQEYLEVVKSLQDEINKMLIYTDEYAEQIDWALEIYQKQYDRWEVDNDSIFLDFQEDDEEPDGKYYFAPMGMFYNRDPFYPMTSSYKLFKKGTLDFALINQAISTKIIEIYDGINLKFLKETTGEREKRIISQFTKMVNEKWTNDLPSVDIDYNEFWIENRKYIQGDKEIKRILYERIDLWEYNIKWQLQVFSKSLREGKEMLDSLILAMDKEKFFLYWKIN